MSASFVVEDKEAEEGFKVDRLKRLTRRKIQMIRQNLGKKRKYREQKAEEKENA